ncbi:MULTISPECIES: hypothetical protein [unclassified Microbacterium]|uniref:hypothetical protein n=1 Tax=unclassified Microbacterium TaxID=2609290 RepID=UPI001604EB10|nr:MULTISPECIES: hypothetical protein [unclassified Microbacterium]QNA93231.1 hypothetical protein G4G29_14590 [Microbacterium sp. Se63.02b]QYM63439.1 hypothetical protein K1X59_14640 [Microbacterium sp. Se5.02b]
MTENVLPELPRTIGDSVNFSGGSSGHPVTITRISDDTFEVLYDLNPSYRATLKQDGRDSFFLSPDPGVAAVGGGWDSWAFFHEHF